MKFSLAPAFALIAILLCGCGTVAKGATQTVQITSVPEGAHFVVSPSGQTGTTPAEVKLERRFDYKFEFSYPGYKIRKAYIRRAIAEGPQWGNVASCLVLPFICMAGSGIDEKSGGQFNLVPNPLHVELVPGTETSSQLTQIRAVFFNDSKLAARFSVDGEEECRLGLREFAVRLLQSGIHRIDANHRDLLKMDGTSTLQFDDGEMFIAILSTVYSTQAAFANELPTDFVETCIKSESNFGNRPAVSDVSSVH